MRRRSVWIVSHFEYLGPPYWRDEIVSHVATTKSRALGFLRSTHVDAGSWWGLQSFPVDDPEGVPGPQLIYSRDVRVLRSGYTLKQALTLGRKIRSRNAALRRRVGRHRKKKGGTKQAPSRPS